MKENKAAVFILLGQSNAVGHGIPMDAKDVISTPLTNVFGLSREHNQSFDISELHWSGYTSFGMNLAEEQDNTYSIANCLATLWQNHIDDGNKNGLPDLYIIQIAVGAQGVSEGYMWNPKKVKKLFPGKLGSVNIALFALCNHIFSLLDDSFSKLNKEYEIIGLHWRGGESDAGTDREYLVENLENIYTEIFDSFNGFLYDPKIILHKLVCGDRMSKEDPTGKKLENMHYINEVFDKLTEKYKNASVFDPRTAPQYVPDARGNGLFIEDIIHFTPQVNQWIAEDIIEKYTKKTAY